MSKPKKRRMLSDGLKRGERRADPTPTEITIMKIRIRQGRAQMRDVIVRGDGKTPPNVSPRCRPVPLHIPE